MKYFQPWASEGPPSLPREVEEQPHELGLDLGQEHPRQIGMIWTMGKAPLSLASSFYQQLDSGGCEAFTGQAREAEELHLGDAPAGNTHTHRRG